MATSTPTITTQQRTQHDLVTHEDLAEIRGELESWFGSPFTVWDGETGNILPGDTASVVGDENLVGSLVTTIAQRGTSEFIVDDFPICIIAIPFQASGHPFVATAPFCISSDLIEDQRLTQVAHSLALPENQVDQWLSIQPTWTHDSLERMAKLAVSKLSSDIEMGRLNQEIEKVSDSLSSTYEEISLLYGLTQNLRISNSQSELAEQALQWLTEVMPCESMAIHFVSNADEKQPGNTNLLSVGDFTLTEPQLAELIDHLKLNQSCAVCVANERITSQENWPLPSVRQVIAVPLAEGDNVFGWIFAINHQDNKGFGSVESSLLSSVGTILGIHNGNIELYKQQADFVTSVVKALTSAVDAKDPYTCGHSDRVARLAVRIAQEFELDTETLNLLYMAGLLHDVGKIGIDDSVLRKPGRLNDEEYEHIKQHPQLGYNILKDLKQLEEVLPVVLHHHERWDGQGYPHGLKEEENPILARITAVADSYDAMTSDRPYRKGMPEEKVKAIFREGAGTQWDPKVIEAFFAVHEDMQAIISSEPDDLRFDVRDWAE
ncbi:MAG: phosphohydrolase [Blastopirellula sp.]|nr:MAG: phosphohydrolase [Blastopirellula sp.]